MSPAWASGTQTFIEKEAAGATHMTPEYINFNNAPTILAVTSTFFAIALLTFLGRVHVRIFMLKVFGPDDYIMLWTMALTTAVFACFVAETHTGMGRHLPVVLADPAMWMQLNKIMYVHSILIMVAVSSVKISVAAFLLRLSTKQAYKRFLYGVIVFLIAFTLGCAGSLIFQCVPVAAAWDSSLRPPPLGTGHAKCYNLNIFRAIGLFNSVVNIATDALFATLPVPLIWQLQLNMRTKVSLIAVLSLGYFAAAAAIVKAVAQWTVLFDPQWTVHDTFNVWNWIELTIGIAAACLPSLKPLFKWFLESASALTSRSRGRRSKATYGRGYQRNSTLGYFRAKDDTSSRSIGLQSLGSRGDQSSGAFSKDPYNVHVTGTLQKDLDSPNWDADARKKSDESILPLPRPEPRKNEIMMTREVTVT